jgi:ribosomal-protein-alanine N-acetyltransferase
MNEKHMDKTPAPAPAPLVSGPPLEFKGNLKYAPPTDEDMNLIAQLRTATDPWKSKGETQAQSLEALSKLRPFAHIARLSGALVGYVTIERDGPVPGAAYLRNIVVRPDLRQKGLGAELMNHGLGVARDMNRKTVALRVDPANAAAVNFYRKNGFTTVATVVSKKSGKLRLLMSREV